jgi:hypothetical protein
MRRIAIYLQRDRWTRKVRAYPLHHLTPETVVLTTPRGPAQFARATGDWHPAKGGPRTAGHRRARAPGPALAGWRLVFDAHLFVEAESQSRAE